MQSFTEKIEKLTKVASVEKLNWSYRPNGWTVKQVIHHFADSHMNSFIRFKLALTERIHTGRPYNEDVWVNLAIFRDKKMGPSIKEFDQRPIRFGFCTSGT